MPSYAGFSGLAGYIETRCRERGISERELSQALGRGHAYINAIKAGRYAPTRKAADDLARYFGDSPRVVRVLSGLEYPPQEESKTIAELKDLAASLPAAGQRELLQYARFLQQKYAPSED